MSLRRDQPLEQFHLRAEASELARWKACAEADGRSLNAWIRRALDAAADTIALPTKAARAKSMR